MYLQLDFICLLFLIVFGLSFNGGLVAKLCLTRVDPMDCSPPGSSVHGVFHAGILEWVTISFESLGCQYINVYCPQMVAVLLLPFLFGQCFRSLLQIFVLCLPLHMYKTFLNIIVFFSVDSILSSFDYMGFGFLFPLPLCVLVFQIILSYVMNFLQN